VKYVINGERYLHPTPGGAYYAVSRTADEAPRRFLQALLRERETPAASPDQVSRLAGMDEQDALRLLYHMQAGGLIEGLEHPMSVPDDSLEAMLPDLLAQLSDTGRAVLAERRGLHMGTAGFNHESTEEFAALAADLMAVHERYEKLLHRNVRARGDGWGLVNASGYAEIGCWPLHIGAQRFFLVIGGLPQFNQAAYTTLVWTLAVRYGGVGETL
jgi:hypothetical protein